MCSCTTEDLVAELELLRAMWSEDELRVEEVRDATQLAVKLAPMTAGNEDKQFLWCELQLHVGCKYPLQPPSLDLGSSRGLSDDARASLLTELTRHAEELRGEPMLFALLEAGRAALTALNAPEGECAICLGSLSGLESEQVLRMPCYHVFHRPCVIAYCQSEISREQGGAKRAATGRLSMQCPECRADIPWTEYPELQKILAHQRAESPESLPGDEPSRGQSEGHEVQDSKGSLLEERAGNRKQSVKVMMELEKSSHCHEAFIRLHHLYQGNDEKEKPLLRLLKELGLDAMVFYGKPALLHIQGDSRDVDTFAGTAKRRHITVTIDVVQRSQGPPLAAGIAGVAAKKGSLDSAALKGHLAMRGRGETTFTVIGS